MKIVQVDPLPNVNKFKNKEDFCNKLIQEVINITKNNSLMEKSNKRIFEVTNYRNSLILKNQDLDKLLEKSNKMKEDLTDKINMLTEDNARLRDKFLLILQPEKE